MIISKTPFRISFFGGGTDFEPYFKKYGGAVISTSINKYCYVTVRTLPPFFDYKTHLTYNKTEHVNDIESIDHPAIKNAMKYLDVDNIRLVFDADIPARSGVGSSSSFAVGMLNCFYHMKGKNATKETLAKDAIHLERVMCKEVGGWQDEIAAAYGGFNRIDFDKDGFKVRRLDVKDERLKALNDNLLLYFTGFTRNSFEVQAKNYDVNGRVNPSEIKLSDEKIKTLDIMKGLVDRAEKIIVDDKVSLDEWGKLLNETWVLKKSTGSGVSTSDIDKIYDRAIDNGALGGKILGAGGGGFILFYVPKDKQLSFREKFKDKLEVPFRFENDGTMIIHDSGV